MRGRLLGLTSKIPPLGSMLHFDADVKNKTTARHQCENCFGCVLQGLKDREHRV